jgi:multidrug resistance efflux pump
MGFNITTPDDVTQTRVRRWLARQGRLIIGGATRGCLYLSSKDSAHHPEPSLSCHWPDLFDEPGYFQRVCNRAEKEQRGVVLTFQEEQGLLKKEDHSSGSVQIAFPLLLTNGQYLVSAFEICPKDQQQLRAAMLQLESGLHWLKDELLTSETEDAETSQPLSKLVELQKRVGQATSFTDASQLLVDALEKLLGCQRVSLGLYQKQRVQLAVISSQATIDAASPVVQDIEQAMEECYDQGKLILYPQTNATLTCITRQHLKLAKTQEAGSLMSQPVPGNDTEPGFILLAERSATTSFQPAEAHFFEAAALALTPILLAKLHSQYRLMTLISHRVKKGYRNFLTNKNRVQLKAAATVALLLFCFFAKGDFRVEADVTLTGTIVRSIVAPFPGYVAQAKKNAGDHVEVGETLAILDTTDLSLDQLSWTSKYTQADLEYRKAVADNDTSRAKIIAQQKKQAEIQLSLLQLQKERAEIKAPFSGIIITGDLSQSVGGPVERGKLLFEMVPDDGFKILAQVDEKDISLVEKGQSGVLVFNSLPRKSFHFSLTTITPVATAIEGHNSFRVEALLVEKSDRLRPGMTGYGKITVGRKPLLFIWTRNLRDRIRLLRWKLLP